VTAALFRVTKYIVYFALRAALHAFKFEPVEFSPTLDTFGAALQAFKFAPGELVDRTATSPIQSVVDGFTSPYCSLVFL
jgi:hypothetical protein